MLNLITGKKYRIYIKAITLMAAFIFVFENIGYSFSDTAQNKTSLRKPLDFNDQKTTSRYSALVEKMTERKSAVPGDENTSHKKSELSTGKSNSRAKRIKRSDNEYRYLVLFTAWQRLKEGNSLIAEEVIKLLKPEDRVELSDLALMFDEEVNIVPDALVLSTSPATAELSQPANLHQPAKSQPRSLDAIKNRAILASLDFIYRYGLYRLVIYPEFLAFILFTVLSSILNPGALPFIAAGGTIARINSSDEEWVRTLFVNALTFGAEHIIYVPAVEEKMKGAKIRVMIADFMLSAGDIRLIYEGRKEIGAERLSGPEVQAKFEDFRRQLFELYDLEPGYAVKDKGLIVEEKNSLQSKKEKRLRQKRKTGRDLSNVVTFGSPQGPGEMPLRRGQDKPEDLEDKLLSNPLAFWNDLNITWGQKLACLRQIANERGVGVGLGVTIPVLGDEKIQELITLISREPKESPLHGLASAILREKNRQKTEQDRKSKIQENIAEAKRLQSEGELQAAMEKAEEALKSSPGNQEALSLKDILAQELENRRRRADIGNRLKSGLKTLYESRIRLRNKKITKEERASLESAAREARSLIRTLSVEHVSIYLNGLTEYERETRFYEEMLEILVQRVFELEREKALPILEAIAIISPKAMPYFWQNKSRLKNMPIFRQILLDFMLSQGDKDLAVLNSYLRSERDFIISSVLEKTEGKGSYIGVLLKLMLRQELRMKESIDIKVKEDFESETLEMIRIAVERDIDNLDYVLALPINEAKLGLREKILGFLFLKTDNFMRRILDSLSEEEVPLFTESYLKGSTFYEAHGRQDIANAMRVSLVRILERATDFVYEKSSFELPRNISLLIEYLQNKGEFPESVFSVRAELTPYLEEYDYDRLVEALKKEDISYKERLAILYRIAILWTGILKGKGNLKEIEAMCQESDFLTRANFYYALALVRSPKHYKTIADNIMGRELSRIIGGVVLSGGINRDTLMSILYELKLGDSYNKLFLAYGVVASLGIKRSMSVEIPGENLSRKILKEDGVPLIKEALSEAVQNDWIINDAEDKEIIEDIIWLLGQPESVKRRTLDRVVSLLSRGKSNTNVRKDYEKIISDVKANASGLEQGSVNMRQSL